MKKKRKSRQWLQQHTQDPWVKKAQQEGFRSRASYKLLEIQRQESLFCSGDRVIDLGAAPGGWSQVVVRCLRYSGQVLALDMLPMNPINGVEFLQGDFKTSKMQERLTNHLRGLAVNAVISDMAPNLSGIRAVDQARSMALCETALTFARRVLAQRGVFLIKVFQGEGFDEFYQRLKVLFKTVKVKKPRASKSNSYETYLLARQLLQ